MVPSYLLRKYLPTEIKAAFYLLKRFGSAKIMIGSSEYTKKKMYRLLFKIKELKSICDFLGFF